MSSTTEQAAAVTTPAQTTEQEKARIVELKNQYTEAATAKATYEGYLRGASHNADYYNSIPKDSPAFKQLQSWQEDLANQTAKAEQLKAQYDSLYSSSSPAVKDYAENHPATPYELRYAGVKEFGGDLITGKIGSDVTSQDHKVRQSIDQQRFQVLQDRAKQNPNATISQVVDIYRNTKPVEPNATINYEATLAARGQGLNVGSGIVTGLAPTFQKEEEKRFAERNKFIGLVENVYTAKEPAPKSYTVNLTENIRTRQGSLPANNISPELTQEQVNRLTPEEYQAYVKSINDYNQLIKEKNLLAKKENLASYTESKAGILAFIKEAKGQGIKFITIGTKSGSKTVPIDQAYYSIISTKGITGISAVPNIPEGYTVGGTIENPVFVSEGRQFIGPEKPKEQDYLKNFLKLTGGEGLGIPATLEKYHNEPGRVISNEKLVNTRDVSGLISTAIENKKPIEQKAKDFFEGIGTGLLRTSLIITNVAPEATIKDIQSGKIGASGDEVLRQHEIFLTQKGVGPSAVTALQTGENTGRSSSYNVGELTGEVLPLLYGLKNAFKNPFGKTPKAAKVPQSNAPEIVETALKTKQVNTIKAYPVSKLPNMGLEERPTLGKAFVPPEEGILAKARNIPKPPTEIGGGKGAKDYGNLRKQIAGIKEATERTTPKTVQEQPFYNPTENIPKTRAKEIGTYRVQTEKIVSRDTTNPLKDIQSENPPAVQEGSTPKPSIKETLLKLEAEKNFSRIFEKPAFVRSAMDAAIRREKNVARFTETKTDLGKGGTKKLLGLEKPIGFKQQVRPLGTGRGFYVSKSTGESGLKRFTPPKAPPPEGPTKGRQQLVLEKPTETKGFSKTTIQLGTAKKAGLVAAGGGASLAPLPLVHPEEGGATLTNATNGTVTTPNQTGTIILPVEQPAQEQPLVESTTSEKAVAAISGTSQKQKTLEQLAGAKTAQKEKEKQAEKFKQPVAFATKLVQPQKTRQRQPFPVAERITFATPQRFAQALEQPQELKLIQRQPQLQKLKIPKPPEGPKLKFFKEERRKKKAQLKKKTDFLGNVSEVQVEGMFNRREITLGVKKAAKQERKDTRQVLGKRGLTKFVSQRTGHLLSNKSKSLLSRPDKKEIRRRERRGIFF